MDNRKPTRMDQRTGDWTAAPANDRLHPWVGLLPYARDLAELYQPPGPDEELPDYGTAHLLPIPPPADTDRAYRPTLTWENSIPGIREGIAAEKAQLDAWARRSADAHFTRPKTAAEVGIPDQQPTFQQQLDSMPMGEKLRLLLDNLMGRR